MTGRIAPGRFPPRPSTYSYLLGLYLGDGCIYEPVRGSPILQIRLDRGHPAIIEEARVAVELLLPPSARVHVYEDRRCFSSTVKASYQHWLEVLPQHGPGRKHNRRIVLRPWQHVILGRAPQAYLRGLIHSDGCRTINRFTTKLPSGPHRGVRLSPLLLFQPFGRHPRAVLRVLRVLGHTLDAVEPPQHLRIPPRERGGAGFLRRAEDMTRAAAIDA